MPISNTPGRIFGRRIRRTNNVEDGVYTLNEARGVLGLDRIESGNGPMFLTAQGPVPLRDARTPQTEPPAGAVED